MRNRYRKIAEIETDSLIRLTSLPVFLSAGAVEFFDIKREKIRPDNLRVAQSVFEEFPGPVDHEFFLSSTHHFAFEEIFPKISTTEFIEIIHETRK